MHRRNFIEIFILWLLGVVIPIDNRIDSVEKKHELFIPFVIDEMPPIYVSPNGSISGSGTRNDPYDLATGQARMVSGSTMVFLDGVYRLAAGETTIGFGPASTVSARTTFKAYAGARPLITLSNDDCPRVECLQATRLDGLWIGGTRIPTFPLISPGTDVELEKCTFFGFRLGIGEGGNKRNSTLDCRFVNCGDGLFDHPIYISAIQEVGEGMIIDGNFFVGCEGYSIHLYSEPSNTIVQHNIIGNAYLTIAAYGAGHKIKLNVIWNNSRQPSLNTSPNFTGLFTKNVLGPGLIYPTEPARGDFKENIFMPGVTPIGSDPVSWKYGDETEKLGYSTAKIESTFDAIETIFQSSVDDLQRDTAIEGHFSILENIKDRLRTDLNKTYNIFLPLVTIGENQDGQETQAIQAIQSAQS